MATSPNYGWLEPDNTDLVKNGALAIRTLGNAIDTTMATMTPKSTFTAKGSIAAATAASTPANLAVGANDGVLSAASGETTGLKYAGLTQTYTPLYSGTIGNGTIIGKWVQVGKAVNVLISLTLGSTTVIASDNYFSLPINASTDYINGASSLGQIAFQDAGTASYFGIAFFRGGGFVNVYVANVSGTYGTLGNISSTVPFTWTSTDAIVLNLSYQVA